MPFQTIEVTLAAMVLLLDTSNGLPSCEPCKCFSHKGEITADCAFKHLYAIPTNLPRNITTLNISHNSIGSLDGNSFSRYEMIKRLDISNNALNLLEKDTFISLESLVFLDIHSNSLRLDNHTYPEGLFRNQKKLEVLFAHNNSDVQTSINDKQFRTTKPRLGYPDVTFSDLISLTVLRIDGILNARFGDGFQNLSNLSMLILSGSPEGRCVINTLGNDTFTSLPAVKFLDVSNCELREIEAACFQPLKDLHTLDLSSNVDLTIPKVGRSMYGTINSSLEVLKMNKIYRRRGPGVVITAEDVKYLKGSSLKEIHIDSNKVELLDLEVISSLPKTVRGVSAKNNNFFFGPYMLGLSTLSELRWADVSLQDQSHVNPFSVGDEAYRSDLVKMIDDFSFDKLGQLRSIAKSSERINTVASTPSFSTSQLKNVAKVPVHIPSPWLDFHHTLKASVSPQHKANKSSYTGWPGNFTIYVPPNGTYLNVSNSKMKYTIPRCKFGENKLKMLDMSNNFFVRWEGPIIGLDDLEYVDLSHNYCDYIADEFTNHFPSLKVLNISSNYLGATLKDNSLSRLYTLEFLDLSENKITYLPWRLFNDLNNITHINISVNSLKAWNASVSHLANLSVLDISQNQFEEVPPVLRSQLDDIKSTIFIYLHGNNLKCDCEYLLFMKWMETRTDEGTRFDFPLGCLMDGKTVTLTAQTVKAVVLQLEKGCASYVGEMIGCLSIVVLVLSVAVWGLLYRYRWKLRYLYYLTRRRYRGYETVEEEGHFKFDAFISYADEDRWLVVTDMRHKLENDRGLKLCIHHRDFLVGEAIAANILDAVRTSRKTVAILSKNFLASHWCKYEVEMARMEGIYTGRNPLVVVLLEDVPVSSLSCDLTEVMRHESYIEYTTDNHGQEVFWENLKRAIMAPGNEV